MSSLIPTGRRDLFAPPTTCRTCIVDTRGEEAKCVKLLIFLMIVRDAVPYAYTRGANVFSLSPPFGLDTVVFHLARDTYPTVPPDRIEQQGRPPPPSPIPPPLPPGGALTWLLVSACSS